MIRILILFLVAIGLNPLPPLYGNSSAQTKTDSLKQLIPSSQNKELADLYNQISWEFRNANSDSTVHYANLANQLSTSIGYDDGTIQSLNYLGIGYRNQSNYSKAFEYFVEALKGSEEAGNLEQEGYSLINIGNIYIYQTNYVGAIEYFENAIKPASKLNNLGMLAYCYLNLGRTYSRIEQYDKAEDYFLKTRKIREDLNDTNGIITSNADIAELHRLRGDLDKALEFFFLSYKDTQKINNYGAMTFSLNNIAKIYRQKNDLDNAEKYALEALEAAKKYELKNDERKVLENLSLIYQQKGQHEKALILYKDHIYKKDSIFNEESTRKIEEMRAEYKAEKQEVETKLLKQQAELNRLVIERQRAIIIVSALGIILFLVITVIAYRSATIRDNLNIQISQQRDQALKDKKVIEEQSQKLEALDMAKSRFFSNISHDLRSPLSIIIGNQEEVINHEENFLTQKSKEYLDVAHKNAQRLLYLTDEINELTKLEEGKIQIKPAVVKIKPYLNMLVSMFKSTAEFKKINIEFKSTLDDKTNLAIDPYQFEKIIYNLISNALKHSKQNDTVTVSLEIVGQDLCIDIMDTGEGIPESSLPYIFDRYYQSPENKYHVYEGLGVGLALVKELVKLHDGSLDVKSKVGIGTTFTLKLNYSNIQTEGVVPEQSDYITQKNSLWAELWEKTYQNENPIELNLLNNKNGDYKNILIVEDHPEVREYIKGLVDDKFNVLEAENGLKALGILDKGQVDLVITDLMMPWMDGFELLKKMQEHETFSKIPVLVVSARNTDDDRFKVLSSGVNDILHKPFNRAELFLRINNLLSKNQNNGSQISPLIFNDTNLIGDLEKELLEKIEKLVLDRIDDSNLSVLHLADAMAASERKVYRMIKKLTNLTPYDYIKEVRWQYLEHLVKNKKVKNASEAAKSIGMKNVTNFKNQYKKRFNRGVEESLVKTT